MAVSGAPRADLADLPKSKQALGVGFRQFREINLELLLPGFGAEPGGSLLARMALTVSHSQLATLQGIRRPSSLGLFMTALMISSDADDSSDKATVASSNLRLRANSTACLGQARLFPTADPQRPWPSGSRGLARFPVDRIRGNSQRETDFVLEFGRGSRKKLRPDGLGCAHQQLAQQLERKIEPQPRLLRQLLVVFGRLEQGAKPVSTVQRPNCRQQCA